jgi:hypothetical protein
MSEIGRSSAAKTQDDSSPVDILIEICERLKLQGLAKQ